MAPTARDRISVDLHGLKAALVAQARAERVGVSVLVRRAVERELGVLASTIGAPGIACVSAPRVKLAVRLTSEEAASLDAAARRAGLSRSAYVAGMLAQVPSLVSGSASRPECLAALNASCAELSTLSRNVHHLTSLLRHGHVQAALEYRRMLNTLDADVRTHLAIAATALAELRPSRRSAAVTEAPRAPTGALPRSSS